MHFLASVIPPSILLFILFWRLVLHLLQLDDSITLSIHCFFSAAFHFCILNCTNPTDPFFLCRLALVKGTKLVNKQIYTYQRATSHALKWGLDSIRRCNYFLFSLRITRSAPRSSNFMVTWIIYGYSWICNQRRSSSISSDWYQQGPWRSLTFYLVRFSISFWSSFPCFSLFLFYSLSFTLAHSYPHPYPPRLTLFLLLYSFYFTFDIPLFLHSFIPFHFISFGLYLTILFKLSRSRGKNIICWDLLRVQPVIHCQINPVFPRLFTYSAHFLLHHPTSLFAFFLHHILSAEHWVFTGIVFMASYI